MIKERRQSKNKSNEMSTERLDVVEWWLEQCGVVLENVCFREDEFGNVGLFATREIQPGEALVPPIPCIDTVSERHEAIHQIAQDALQEINKVDEEVGVGMDHLALFLFALVELGKGQKSDLWFYFASWPSLESVQECFPVFWAEQDVEQLVGTQAHVAIVNHMHTVSWTIDAVLRVCPEDVLLLAPEFTSLREQALYAFCCFHSRVLPHNGSSCLFPVLEFINGSRDSHNNAVFVTTSALEREALKVVATQRILAGQEILCPYFGSQSNANLLVHFGMTLGQPTSTMLILMPSVYDALAEEGIEFLKSRLGKNCEENAGKLGVVLHDPESELIPRGIVAFLSSPSFASLGPWKGLHILAHQLAAFHGSFDEDSATLSSSSLLFTKSRLIAAIRSGEKSLLFQWCLRFAIEMEFPRELLTPEGVSKELFKGELWIDFCGVCGSTLGLEACKDCGMWTCSDEHRREHLLTSIHRDARIAAQRKSSIGKLVATVKKRLSKT